MKYERISPPHYLRNHVWYFWTLESLHADPLSQTLGPLVNGCPGLIFQQHQHGIFYDQQGKQLPEIFLYGQTLTRTAIQLLGKFRATGVCFYPNTLKSVFGFDATELTDACLDVTLLSLQKDTCLNDQLLHAETPINDSAAIQKIRNGKGFMPGFKKKLTALEVNQIVTYIIKTLRHE